MTYKWVGAALIIAGCGGYGMSLALKFRKEEKYLFELKIILQYMISELQYKLTPLPELCRQSSRHASGVLREILGNLSTEMDLQLMPDARSCMAEALKKSRNAPSILRRLLIQLASTLGQFDLPGQICGIQGVQSNCEEALKRYRQNKDIRVRNYQTLGLCSGAALAIILA